MLLDVADVTAVAIAVAVELTQIYQCLMPEHKEYFLKNLLKKDDILASFTERHLETGFGESWAIGERQWGLLDISTVNSTFTKGLEYIYQQAQCQFFK